MVEVEVVVVNEGCSGRISTAAIYSVHIRIDAIVGACAVTTFFNGLLFLRGARGICEVGPAGVLLPPRTLFPDEDARVLVAEPVFRFVLVACSGFAAGFGVLVDPSFNLPFAPCVLT
jgi:hypothetical protein